MLSLLLIVAGLFVLRGEKMSSYTILILPRSLSTLAARNQVSTAVLSLHTGNIFEHNDSLLHFGHEGWSEYFGKIQQLDRRLDILVCFCNYRLCEDLDFSADLLGKQCTIHRVCQRLNEL